MLTRDLLFNCQDLGDDHLIFGEGYDILIYSRCEAGFLYSHDKDVYFYIFLDWIFNFIPFRARVFYFLFWVLLRSVWLIQIPKPLIWNASLIQCIINFCFFNLPKTQTSNCTNKSYTERNITDTIKTTHLRYYPLLSNWVEF